MPTIETKTQLIDYFNQGAKVKDQLLIGVEHEKFLFSGKEKKRASYKQIKKIFKNLESFNWEPIFEKENVSSAIATLRTLNVGIKDEHIQRGITKISK